MGREGHHHTADGLCPGCRSGTKDVSVRKVDGKPALVFGPKAPGIGQLDRELSKDMARSLGPGYSAHVKEITVSPGGKPGSTAYSAKIEVLHSGRKVAEIDGGFTADPKGKMSGFEAQLSSSKGASPSEAVQLLRLSR